MLARQTEHAMGPLTKDSVKERGRRFVDQALVKLGEHANASVARVLNGSASYIETGRLLREAGLTLPAPVPSRFDVFDAAIELAQSATQPLYLEFGVWEGRSITHMSEHLATPAGRFVGFDSFEGLPETWTATFGRGAFSTAGVPPVITDTRVSYVSGWFDETLPGFAIPPHDRLIVNVDCDIYSSAATVLAAVGPALEPGDLLYFDEFHDRLHEGRAFHEFRAASGYTFRVIAATAGATHILFERVS
jgi:hypothetical protein